MANAQAGDFAHGEFHDPGVDVTAPETDGQRGAEDAITAAVADICGKRAVIEQAKGVLMFVYRIDADAAFELLKWRSQETNTKLRTLAEQLVADIQSMDEPQEFPVIRTAFDRLLMTAHHYERKRHAWTDAETELDAPFPGGPTTV